MYKKPTIKQMQKWAISEVDRHYRNFCFSYYGETFEWDKFPEYCKENSCLINLDYKVSKHDLYLVKNMLEEYAKEVMINHDV